MNPSTDPFTILPDAFRAVLRSPRALALYIALAMGVVSLKLAIMYALTGGGDMPDDPEMPVRLVELVTDLVLAGTWAFAQTVAFSWLGQDLDRPLWRIKGIRDAMARFFYLWLMLDLLIIVFSTIAGKLLEADITSPMGQFMLLLFMTMQVIAIPIGAAIMFHGELKWRELGQSLAPLGRQFFATFMVVAFSACILVALLFIVLPATADRLWMRPLIEIPSGFTECMVFAATWFICIMDREAEPEGDDFDF